jgi:hypothetical protein
VRAAEGVQTEQPGDNHRRHGRQIRRRCKFEVARVT